MAIIFGYEEEPDTIEKPRLNDPTPLPAQGLYDETLDRLLQQHNNQPLEVLEMIYEFPVRRTDAFAQDKSMDSKISTAFLAARAKLRQTAAASSKQRGASVMEDTPKQRGQDLNNGEVSTSKVEEEQEVEEVEEGDEEEDDKANEVPLQEGRRSGRSQGKGLVEDEGRRRD